MKRSLAHLLFSVALVALSACTAAKGLTGDERIYLDAALNLEVRDVYVERNHGGTLDLQAELINHHGSEQLAQYKVEWLDDAGNFSDSILSRWTPLRLTVGAPVHFRATAPNSKISDYRLQIRRNKAEGYE